MSNQKKLIEMACTGNNGRSPMAELIAHNTLKEIGELDRYNSVSSGTLVNAINSGDFPMKGMIPIIEIAMNRDDIYNTKQLKQLEIALKTQDPNTVKEYFDKAADIFAEEERISRGIALQEFGIKGDVKTTPTQTIITPNTIALYVMDKQNLKRANTIYESSEYSPKIESLDVESSFGLGREAYMEGVEKLLDNVPKAVDKAISILE